jgi:hypothetical protein
MLKKALTLTVAAVFLAGAAFAGAPQNKPKANPKPIVVNICPMMLEKASPSGGSSTFGRYRVNFCCPNCKPAFDKLSAKEKEAKIKAALKKQGGKS